LVVFTPTAPFPASPSHPAAPAILSTLKATQKGYADMRGIWSRKCLEAQGKRFIDRAETVDSIVAGKDFGRWLELLLSVADEKYGCIKDLSPLNIPNVVASPYNALLNPILFLFSTTLTSVIALIKRSPRTRRCSRCSRAGTPFAPDSRNFNANERKTGAPPRVSRGLRDGVAREERPWDGDERRRRGTLSSAWTACRRCAARRRRPCCNLGDGNRKMGDG
ncbi:hypothetical protein B0H14DRAFT_2391985, partial [Mycena olivaceomarginata]